MLTQVNVNKERATSILLLLVWGILALIVLDGYPLYVHKNEVVLTRGQILRASIARE